MVQRRRLPAVLCGICIWLASDADHVCSMLVRSLWNGWPTSRRMRSAPGSSGTQPCLMGCERAQDCIEHYLVCPAAWEVFRKHRGIELGTHRRTRQAMLLAERGLEEREIQAIAIAVYALARTVHAMRSKECAAAPLLRLFLQEGMRRSM